MRGGSLKLVRTLVQSCLAAPSSGWTTDAVGDLAASGDADWQWALEQLSLHRLVEHAFYSLETLGLTAAVPQQQRLLMAAQYLRSVRNSGQLLSALDALLEASWRSGLDPLVIKGIVLADYFYPVPAARPMGDLDLVFNADEMQRVPDAFALAGFTPCPEKGGGDAIYFLGAEGVQCDAHFRQRLFEGKESLQLTTKVVPSNLQHPSMRIYEPSAMLVHLVVHLDGHWPKTGPLLCWIMDLALVLRKWGDLIDPARVTALVPQQHHLVLLGRLVAFLRDELGETLPQSLAHLASGYRGFTLEQLLRQRRLRAWGLPGARGWGRVLAHRLGVSLKRHYPRLCTSDLLLWTADAAGARRAFLSNKG